MPVSARRDRTTLRLTDTYRSPVPVPPDRGRLLTAEAIARDLFGGTRSPDWVKRNVPGKRVLGHSTVRWWEYEVIAWIDGRTIT